MSVVFPAAVAHRAPPPGQWPPAWAVAWGDDRYGLWAELAVTDARLSGGMALSGSPHQVVQRFRWIEPGSFLMGSPDDEPERFVNEGPQHCVTLSLGFWLADTTCTQEFWLAVVGGQNPSHFKDGAQLPVDRVSWHDVMNSFMPKLPVGLTKDVTATLPTEAQWEYACRAGSETVFSFGERIHPGQVNYDGKYPYNDGPEGKHRKHTVPVKELPANRWGLYQMHGNVWEWCLDGPRNYRHEDMIDPMGDAGGGLRVLRGGSWLLGAKDARSACRSYDALDGRDNNFGFRVALTFKPQGPEAQDGAGGA